MENLKAKYREFLDNYPQLSEEFKSDLHALLEAFAEHAHEAGMGDQYAQDNFNEARGKLCEEFFKDYWNSVTKQLKP